MSATLDDYRDYLRGSRGEWSVAKNAYVATRSGWFSTRSAAYLACRSPGRGAGDGVLGARAHGAGAARRSRPPTRRWPALDAVRADYGAALRARARGGRALLPRGGRVRAAPRRRGALSDGADRARRLPRPQSARRLRLAGGALSRSVCAPSATTRGSTRTPGTTRWPTIPTHEHLRAAVRLRHPRDGATSSTASASAIAGCSSTSRAARSTARRRAGPRAAPARRRSAGQRGRHQPHPARAARRPAGGLRRHRSRVHAGEGRRGDVLLRAILDEHDAHCHGRARTSARRARRVPTAGYHLARRRVRRWRSSTGADAGPGRAYTTVGKLGRGARRDLTFRGETFAGASAPSGSAASICPPGPARPSRSRWTSRACPATYRCSRAHGWAVADPLAVSADPLRYRDYPAQLARRVHRREGRERPAAERLVQRPRGLLPGGRAARGRAGHRLRRRPAARARACSLPHAWRRRPRRRGRSRPTTSAPARTRPRSRASASPPTASSAPSCALAGL